MSAAPDRRRFRGIEIQGFRRLADVSIPMRDLAVMIGANGAGKSSILDAWSLLGESSKGNLRMMMSAMGGIQDLLTRDEAEDLRFRLAWDQESSPGCDTMSYLLRIEPRGHAYTISDESLRGHRLDGTTLTNTVSYIEAQGPDVRYFEAEANPTRPNWEQNPFESSLAQGPKTVRAIEAFRQRLSSYRYYSAGYLDVTQGAPIRRPQQLQPFVGSPSPRGEDLVSYLYSLRETDRDRFEALTDTLSAAFRDFERLDFPPVAAGMLTMTWKDRQFSKPMWLHQLSEGTLRFLWLTSLLLSPDPAAVTLIDEPEVSLHPELLRLLVDLMREAATRTQLFVATQSDRLIRFLKPEEVLVADVDGGKTSLTWADTMDLDRWLADYSLDQLHEMGRLGGRA